MKAYRFVLLSYATELTMGLGVGLVVFGLGLITVFRSRSRSRSHTLCSRSWPMFWSH